MKRSLVISGVMVFAFLVSVFLFYITPRQDILLIPLDSRPANTQYAQMLGELGNAAVILPPAELWDNYLKPAPTEELMDWLERNSAGADKIIIFTNELINGSLIASRDAASYGDMEKQLDRFEEYLGKNKNKDMTVLFVLPRHLPSQFTKLWDYRDSLTRWAEISHRAETGPLGREEKTKLQAKLTLLQKEIPPEVLKRYTQVYAESGLLVKRLVKFTGDSLIDELVIGLDDAAPYGLNIKLYNELKDEISTYPEEKIKLLHGADDLTMLVLAKKLGGLKKSLVFDLIWLYEQDEREVFPYEGVPAGQMIEEKIDYLGGRRGEDGKFKVFIHSRPGDGENVAGRLLEQIGANSKKDSILGLADIAYTNRADSELLAAVGANKVYRLVDTFAGWNTAGNSFGTVLAHSIIFDALNRRFPGNKKGLAVHRQFQAVRIIEDYLYQGMIRESFNIWAQEEGIDTADFGPRWDEANCKLLELMTPALSELSYEGYGAVFPWPRSFEIRVIPPAK